VKRQRLAIDATHLDVRAACEWLEKALSDCLADDRRHEIELASSEILTNIVRYAYEGSDPPGRILLALGRRHKDRVRIFFVDDGKAMPASVADALNAPASESPLPDPLAEGGRGIFLIKSCVDSVRYRRSGLKNILVITTGCGSR